MKYLKVFESNNSNIRVLNLKDNDTVNGMVHYTNNNIVMSNGESYKIRDSFKEMPILVSKYTKLFENIPCDIGAYTLHNIMGFDILNYLIIKISNGSSIYVFLLEDDYYLLSTNTTNGEVYILDSEDGLDNIMNYIKEYYSKNMPLSDYLKQKI